MAQLVRPLQPGAHRAVAGLDAAHRLLEPPGIPGERSRREQHEDGGEHGRQREHTDGCPRLAGVEHHQPGQHDGGDRADGERPERHDEQEVAQRPGALGHAAQQDASADGGRGERQHAEHRRHDFHHGSNR